jgi:hypothetical protein
MDEQALRDLERLIRQLGDYADALDSGSRILGDHQDLVRYLMRIAREMHEAVERLRRSDDAWDGLPGG